MLATKEPTQREITAAHHRLDVFISKRHTEGKSFGDGQTADDPRASGAPWTSDEHYEWLPGGSFLLHQWDALVGTRAFNGTKIIGHYEANGGSFTRFFDNASLHPEYSATIDGAVWNSSNHRHEPLSPFAKTATRSSTYGSGFKTATGYRSASEPRHADDRRTGTTSTHRRTNRAPAMDSIESTSTAFSAPRPKLAQADRPDFGPLQSLVGDARSRSRRRSQTMSVGVIIEHHVRPGSREQVHAIWDQLLRPAIEANLGHEAYSYMYDVEDADVIRAFQQYTDGEAASRFLSTDAYAAYVVAVENLLVGPPTVTRTDIIWSKARELPQP